MLIMRILYKPFAIIAGLIGAQIGRRTFKKLWARIDDAAPPKATTPDVSVRKVVGSRALEAATMAGVAAAVDRASLNWFRYLTGVWAGKPKQDEKKQD